MMKNLRKGMLVVLGCIVCCLWSGIFVNAKMGDAEFKGYRDMT
jgi:hypothetical protein